MAGDPHSIASPVWVTGISCLINLKPIQSSGNLGSLITRWSSTCLMPEKLPHLVWLQRQMHDAELLQGLADGVTEQTGGDQDQNEQKELWDGVITSGFEPILTRG